MKDSWEFSVRKKVDLDSEGWVFQGPEKFADKKWLKIPPNQIVDWNQFVSECKFQAKVSPFYGKQSTAEMNLK